MEQIKEIYCEKISSFWGKLAYFMFFGLSILFAFLFFYQRTNGPIGDNPGPDWIFMMIFCVSLIIGLLLTNFRMLTIRATTSGITVGYGLLRYHVGWGNIIGCKLDKGQGLINYGGYGIRYGRINGKSVLMLNTMRSPVVLIEVKSEKYGYLGFSTKRPDEVMELIKSHKK